MASQAVVLMALGMLQETYNDWEQTEMTERVWSLALRDVDDSLVEQGVAKWLTFQTSQRGSKPPLPGDIRQLALQTVAKVSWDQAFNEIMANAHRVMFPMYHAGHPVPVEWSSPLIPALMARMGGAEYFAALKSEDLGTARAQFRQMYGNEEQQAGGVIAHQQFLTTAEPHRMSEHQLLEYAQDMAERLVHPYRHALTEAEYQEHVFRASKLIARNKKHKLENEPPALPDASSKIISLTDRQQKKAAQLMARIQKHNPTPQMVLNEAVRQFAGREVEP